MDFWSVSYTVGLYHTLDQHTIPITTFTSTISAIKSSIGFIPRVFSMSISVLPLAISQEFKILIQPHRWTDNMAAFSGRKFTVDVSNPAEPISRVSRRIVINSELLKQARIYAGDVVAIISAESPKVKDSVFAFSLRTRRAQIFSNASTSRLIELAILNRMLLSAWHGLPLSYLRIVRVSDCVPHEQVVGSGEVSSCSTSLLHCQLFSYLRPCF